MKILWENYLPAKNKVVWLRLKRGQRICIRPGFSFDQMHRLSRVTVNLNDSYFYRTNNTVRFVIDCRHLDGTLVHESALRTRPSLFSRPSRALIIIAIDMRLWIRNSILANRFINSQYIKKTSDLYWVTVEKRIYWKENLFKSEAFKGKLTVKIRI